MIFVVKVMATRGIMVTVVGNGHNDPVSNPGSDWLYFIYHKFSNMNPILVTLPIKWMVVTLNVTNKSLQLYGVQMCSKVLFVKSQLEIVIISSWEKVTNTQKKHFGSLILTFIHYHTFEEVVGNSIGFTILYFSNGRQWLHGAKNSLVPETKGVWRW